MYDFFGEMASKRKEPEDLFRHPLTVFAQYVWLAFIWILSAVNPMNNHSQNRSRRATGSENR